MVFAFLLETPEIDVPKGTHNGYVGWTSDEGELPKPLDDLVMVHGGITFDEEFEDYESLALEQYGDKLVKLTSLPSSLDKCRIIGFDTLHYDDGPMLDEIWCREETLDLLSQVESLLIEYNNKED